MRSSRLILAGLLAAALVGCGSAGAPPAGEGVGLAEPTVVQQSVPVALRIPAIGVDAKEGADWLPLGIQGRRQSADPKDPRARLVPVTTKAGEIETPPVKKPKELGWFCPTGLPDCGAPTPGEVGPAIVLGHINGGGQKGVFSRLGEKDPAGGFVLKPGAAVEIDRADGWTATFSVTRVELPEKTDFPTQAVYGNTTGPELRLISCGGTYDAARKSYLDQVIVYAVLTKFQPKAA